MIPRPEYPRPQFVRDAWENLNGEWDFEIDHGDSGRERGLQKVAAALSQKIRVPFCPESELSGVGYKDFMAAVWYKRLIFIADAHLKGRVLLHFGAADYETHVYVNGEEAGVHKGGYSSFCFDITAFLSPGENVLTVLCRDDVRGGRQPRGKQSAEYHSHNCDYTRTTGIWQSVWLEYVGKSYIKQVKVTAGLNGHVQLLADLCAQNSDLELEAAISYKGKQLALQRGKAQAGSTALNLQIPQSDVHLWDVGKPELYDIEYRLYESGGEIDRATGYFGIRSVEIKDHALCLNGRPVFQRLVLDQGFYEKGIYTAPEDKDLRGDIELSLSLGFNGARLHQKVFEERFLYWADRLGYLVWGEQASWGIDHSKPDVLMHFLPEWLEIVARDINHPAIIGWCPFNETWDVEGHRQEDAVLRGVYLATKAADPTRPVIDTSGNFHVVTDIYDVHDYEQDIEVFALRYSAVTKDHVYETFPLRQAYGGQPYFISEFGGAWWAPGRQDGWGYGKAPGTEEEFAQRFEVLTGTLLANRNICGYCYTQLTDIEQEQNGLVAYDRSRKFSGEIYERIFRANQAKSALEGEE